MIEAHRDHEAGCKCTVSLDELGGTLGAPPVGMRSLLRAFGLERAVTDDWAGRPALPMDQAVAFATAYREQREKKAVL